MDRRSPERLSFHSGAFLASAYAWSLIRGFWLSAPWIGRAGAGLSFLLGSQFLVSLSFHLRRSPFSLDLEAGEGKQAVPCFLPCRYFLPPPTHAFPPFLVSLSYNSVNKSFCFLITALYIEAYILWTGAPVLQGVGRWSFHGSAGATRPPVRRHQLPGVHKREPADGRRPGGTSAGAWSLSQRFSGRAGARHILKEHSSGRLLPDTI